MSSKNIPQKDRTSKTKRFTIVKKIAKHGSQSVIIIPKMLEQHLKPGMITQLTIDILENENLEVEWNGKKNKYKRGR